MQCAFQVEFLNFYTDVHNIRECTFAFSIFTICGGDACLKFSLIHSLFLFQAEEGKAEAAAAGPRQWCGRCPTLQRTVPPA